MKWEYWAIDATMGCRDGMFCCCPVELDETGAISNVIVGMNLLGVPPSPIIAIVHEGGDKAVKEFYAAHKDAIDEFIHKSRNQLEVTRT